MVQVEFFDVSYSEKGTTLLSEISVAIESGDLFMIKAADPKEGLAFLKMACELVSPQEGSVEVTSDSEILIGTNIIPFIEDLSAYEILSLPLMARGFSKALVDSRIHEITRYFSVDKILDVQVKDMSNIQKSLLGVCKAVIGEPTLVVLDQFSSNLNHDVAVLVMAYLHEISVDHEVTVIMVENDTKLHPFAAKILYLENSEMKDLVGEGVDLQKLMPFLKL
jgi:ABC-type multidrug transport system ATPase subunit